MVMETSTKYVVKSENLVMIKEKEKVKKCK